jgi:hypothetical protein
MSERALDLFEQMPFDPNDVIYIIILSACAQLANDRAMRIGQNLLDQIPNDFRNHNVLLNSALHMLMRFGDVNRAEHFFELIKKKDSISYNVMMKGNLFIIIYFNFEQLRFRIC